MWKTRTKAWSWGALEVFSGEPDEIWVIHDIQIGIDQFMPSTIRKTPGLQFDIEPHLGRRLDDVEKDLILGTLARCGGNRTWASDILGISVRTLRNKLQRYNDEKPQEVKTATVGPVKSEDDAMLARLRAYNPGYRLPS